LTSSSDERGVENQTILWSLSLGLQSSEKGFFSTEDLDSRRWIFGQVSESTGVRDKLGTNDVTNQSRKIRGNSVHSVFKILSESLSEINQFDASLCKFFDLKAILLGHILSHRNFSSVNDLLSFIIIKNDISNLFFHFVSDIISLFHQKDEFREDIVFIDDFSKLREMPRVPLLQSHNKSINVFI
tara:strand:+ start:93 stop:647 length:555 start_codon:yes stop_codon:yes gene_type:complete